MFVGVQSHQFQRALDLAALAKSLGSMAIIGGAHPMTCDTTMLQGKGVSFSLSEADNVLMSILDDAITEGELKPVYGENQRWATELDPPTLIPPTKADFRRAVVPMLGIYPYRGCPFTCKFCTVIQIAGRRVRGQSISTTIESLRAAKAAGVRMVIFTSDNFNKIPDVVELLETMIEENVCIPFFCQCDTQVASQPELIALMARAGCFDIFVGAESFNRQTLLSVHKAQNYPDKYAEIVKNCRAVGVSAHFSSIIGFEDDTEESILGHLAVLKELDPAMASFYVLCPIPGSEQYDDFMSRGIITETNMDRFDTICPVWEHPSLSFEDRDRLLMRCYREFYTLEHTIRKLKWVRNKPEYRMVNEIATKTGFAAFSRWCTWNNRHPMSGGVWRIKRDHVEDYQSLRRGIFGFDLVPLPKSLKLSEADERLNRVNLRIVKAV